MNVRQIVPRFDNTGSVGGGKSPGRTSNLTDDILEDDRGGLEGSPTKSLSKLSQQSGRSYGSQRTARQLHFHLYKFVVFLCRNYHHLILESIHSTVAGSMIS